MENARRAAFSFFPKRSGGCAPEAFVVVKQPSAALSVTRRKFRHMTCGALAALSRCGADAPGKNERVAPRPRRFHYERAYRASTFEITNLSAQKTRYVSGPLLCCCVPLCSLTHWEENSALSLSVSPSVTQVRGFFPLTFRVSLASGLFFTLVCSTYLLTSRVLVNVGFVQTWCLVECDSRLCLSRFFFSFLNRQLALTSFFFTSCTECLTLSCCIS